MKAALIPVMIFGKFELSIELFSLTLSLKRMLRRSQLKRKFIELEMLMGLRDFMSGVRVDVIKLSLESC